jgi:hypothetical protein
VQAERLENAEPVPESPHKDRQDINIFLRNIIVKLLYSSSLLLLPPVHQHTVADALNFLDTVKEQFKETPDVYNGFLDIMKEFKLGVIDTKGVIWRVSELFRECPSLIQEFSTWLPQDYSMELLSNLKNESASPREIRHLARRTSRGNSRLEPWIPCI